MKSIISTFLALVMAIGMSFGQQSDIKINALIDSVRAVYHIPAMAVAVVKPDTCYFGIGGTSQLNGDISVNLKSKFHLGSNSKAVTSFIAFKMMENQQISLGTTIGELFPELKGKIREAYLQVNLGDLLSHNARIQPYTGGVEYQKLPELKGNTSERRYAFTQFVLNEKPVKKGTYSNAGYVIAALMLEKVSGKTFEELLQHTMSDLNLEYFIGFPNHQDPDYPWGHWMEEEGLIALPPDHFYKLDDYALPAGDIAMNVVDYARYIQLHLKGLLGENNYLESASYQTMHYALDDYSYGWGNAPLSGAKISYHDGSAGTYYCHTIVIPAQKRAIIIMTNSAEEEHVEGIYALRELL